MNNKTKEHLVLKELEKLETLEFKQMHYDKGGKGVWHKIANALKPRKNSIASHWQD